MSEATPSLDRDAEMFARLAEMDLAAAEHVHAQLMAATETGEINSLGRTYQRASRGLRQTLALKAKLKREAAQDAARATERRGELDPAWDADRAHEWRIECKLVALQDGVGRVIHAVAAERPDWLTDLYERLDREMDKWIVDRFFMHRDEDDQVREMCARLQLPPEVAAGWRDLPPVISTPDPVRRAAPAEAPRPDAATPAVPQADTG